MPKFFYGFILFFSIVACKFNPNLQGEGTNYLQGIWKQDSVLYKDKLLAYTLHSFKFTCDSFYLTLNTHAKVNNYADSCFNKGEWNEYVKGTYLVRADTLYLNGTYTKSNFKQKISGCYRVGQYLTAFVLKKQHTDSLMLRDVSQHLPFILRLEQKIDCVPKPLN